jgi:hypothetical protein
VTRRGVCADFPKTGHIWLGFGYDSQVGKLGCGYDSQVGMLGCGYDSQVGMGVGMTRRWGVHMVGCDSQVRG